MQHSINVTMTTLGMFLDTVYRITRDSILTLRDYLSPPNEVTLERRVKRLQLQFETYIDRKNKVANAHEVLINKLNADIEKIDDDITKVEVYADGLKRLLGEL